MQVENPQNQIMSAADRLISAHDGDVALLYIWRLKNPGSDAEQAAHDLCRTAKEISAADEKLTRMGLGAPLPVPSAAPAPAVQKLAPVQQIPDYSSEEIVRRSKEDAAFADLISEAQSLLGRVLSTADLKTLFGIYDYLAMPPELIMLLMNFCVENHREKYGEGRLPTMRTIEKEAYTWVNREILTFEQVEEYIRRHRSRRESCSRVADVLNIHGRELTVTEKKYIGSWLDMGYDADSLAIAYDRTVTNTGALKWGYMDKIVSSWKNKGLFTVQEIEEKDPPHKHPVQTSPAQPDGAYSIDELRSIFDKV